MAPNRAELAAYAAVRGLAVGFSRFWWRLEISGSEHLPADGAFILAPIHRSNADSLVVAGLTKRRLRYMGKHTLWKYKPIGRVFSALGGFPVKRGAADREALRKCAEVLAGGEPLVVFPEGTRQSGAHVHDLQEGAAYLAARAGVPVIPVGIGGSENALVKGSKKIRRVKIHVVAGEALLPPASEGRIPRSAVSRLSDELKTRLQDLFDEAQARSGSPARLPR
ncbi:MAG TPA: lysophospholipid acyltransferase family protein [Acidimicrobiales bacterium]|nr:lysophospholipid acyltransferase family protein [Acidimicrobiales bacterium]